MTSEQLSIEEIVFSLESDDIEEREAAIVRLQAKVKQGLNAQEGIFVLRAASRESLPRKDSFASKISSELVRAAAAYPQSAYIPVIVELYPKYNDSCRRQALQLLAAIEDRGAAIAYMNILQVHIQSNRDDSVIHDIVLRARTRVLEPANSGR